MRAWLFTPGHEVAKLEKALGLGVPVVVDWEDGVPEGAKEFARERSREILWAKPLSTPTYVRINAAKTPWFDEDIRTLRELPEGVGVFLPKAEDPEVVKALGGLGRPVVPMVETPKGVEMALALAQAHPSVERLAFGYLDFLAEIGGRWTPKGEALLYPRSRLIVTSRIAGILGPLDGVYPYLDDPEGLAAEAKSARDMGFAGKLVVHPKHVPVVEQAFAPTPEEIALFEEIQSRLETAKQEMKGAIRLPDGRFVDAAVLAWLKSLVKGGTR